MAISLVVLVPGCSTRATTRPRISPYGDDHWLQTPGPSAAEALAATSAGSTLIVSTGGGTFRSADQGASWTRVTTTSFNCFVWIGTHLFGGRADGVALSTDGGVTWSSVSTGLAPYTPVYALTTQGNVLFATLYRQSFYRSTDEGAHWSIHFDGIVPGSVIGLVARSSDLFVGNDIGQVFRSTDAGDHWTPASTGLRGMAVWALGTDDSTLLAGTGGDGIYTSIDDGASWQPRSTGLPSVQVRTFSKFGADLYAGTTHGLFRWSPGGPWSEVDLGLPEAAQVYGFATMGSAFFATTRSRGVFMTTDGVSWSSIGPPDGVVSSLLHTGGGLFAATPTGIYRSVDEGASWSVTLYGRNVHDLAALGTNLFGASENEAIVRSIDGIHWSPYGTGFPTSTSTMIESNGTTLVSVSSNLQILRSVDQGLTWIPTSGFPASTTVQAHAAAGARFFFVAAHVDSGVPDLYRSIDEGATWQPAMNGLPDDAPKRCFARSGSDLYVGTYGDGVWVTHDGGDTWHPDGLAGELVTTLAARGNEVLAETDLDGAFRSSNGGASWAGVESIYNLTGNIIAGDGRFFAPTATGVWKLPF